MYYGGKGREQVKWLTGEFFLRSFKTTAPLNVPYFHFTWVLKLLSSHKCYCSHPLEICDSNHTHFLSAFNSHSSLPMVGTTDQEKSRNGGPTWPEDCFLSPFVQRRRATAHPVPTKGLPQLSPQAAMLPGLSAETRTPPPVPPFLLAQN